MKDCDQLGKYRIDAILGEGGMGVVYKGWHPTLQVHVAIKTIRRSMLGGREGRELRERFALEARASARLKHDNIVRVYDFEEDAEGDPFFVMDFVEGKSLKDFLARGMHFNLEMSLHIISQILSALAHSHEKGVIHRDIKPANIILLEDDSVKIADFGIAHIEDSDLTQTGKMLGTPQYSSPEQLAGGKIDGRSDLYSTGLVLYELLTGERLIKQKNPGTQTRPSGGRKPGEDGVIFSGKPANSQGSNQSITGHVAGDPISKCRGFQRGTAATGQTGWDKKHGR